MGKKNIKKKLVSIIKEYTALTDKELEGSLDLFERIDSLTLMEIVFKIEEIFDIQIDDEKIKRMKTFDDIVEAIYMEVKSMITN